MRIVFLASTRDDLDWFRRYYESMFPAGAAKARAHYRGALAALRRYPLMERPAELAGNRELVVPKSPFILVHRIRQDRIEIVRVRDGRSHQNDRASPRELSKP